ncbi:MAG: thymidylate kinase [Methanobacterium sp.]|nr:thymidylate kinase [Methanobacterium sp.]
MRFIVIDGLDGSGKDTQAKLIAEKYLANDESVIIRSHPSEDNPYGIMAKKALLGTGKINHIMASVYYALDVIRSVRIYKDSADTVIMVRYLMGVAYLPMPIASLLYKFFITVLPSSEYMFFLDVEPEVLMKRLSNRNETEMFENQKDLMKVRKKALKLSEGWHIIKNEQSIEDSQKRIAEILDELDKENNIQ